MNINTLKLIKLIYIFQIFVVSIFCLRTTNAQTNSSTVTNSTSPAASATTTGGTSINYQTNSSFTNDIGFGPGYVCRTPSIVINGSAATADSDNFSSLGTSGTYGENITGSVGLVIPFGSKVMNYCETIAKQIALDKEISTQLSMIRACASLEKEGIYVDVNKFPLLSDCVVNLGEPDLSKNSLSIRKKFNGNKINTAISKKKIDPKPKLKIPVLLED